MKLFPKTTPNPIDKRQQILIGYASVGLDKVRTWTFGECPMQGLSRPRRQNKGTLT